MHGKAVAVDSFGQAYVLADAGPFSSLFASPNAVQGTPGRFDHTYVAKFNTAGSSIVYGSFLTGSNGSRPGDLTVDSIGNIYASGIATKLGFGLPGAYQPSVAGIRDAYLLKLDPMAPSSLVYGTFLGGSSGESADSLAVDAAGRVYMTGYTQSTNFPTWNAIHPTPLGGWDAYAAAFDPSQSGAASLIYSTRLGGSSHENVSAGDGGIAVDDLGYATVGGTTTSTDILTTAGTIQPALAGSSDAFVYRLDPTGAKVFATYFGGSGLDQLKDLDVDSTGRIALFGYTSSAGIQFPGAFQPNKASSADLFLAVLTPTASGMVQGSYLGGNANVGEHAGGVALHEASCALYAAGHAAAGTPPGEFPTTPNSDQPVNQGGTDAFVIKWPYCP